MNTTHCAVAIVISAVVLVPVACHSVMDPETLAAKCFLRNVPIRGGQYAAPLVYKSCQELSKVPAIKGGLW